MLHPSEPYLEGEHVPFISKHLEAVTTGKLLELGHQNRLQINVPPGTMKSLLISVFWGAWEWGPCNLPWVQTIATSFRLESCKRDSLKFRALIESDWYQSLWGHQFYLTRVGDMWVENNHFGNRKSIPFGSLTGGRAHRVNIDDPHSIDTAESDADRERASRNFRERVPFCLNNTRTSSIALVMQRLHQDDMSGWAERNGTYVRIMLPMEFEPERKCVTPLGEDWRKKEGELLFPARFPIEVVERDKRASTAHAVAAQLQQRPAPRGGLMFKRHWFELVKAAPAFLKRVRGWDLAGTKAAMTKSAQSGPAYTCGVRMGRDPATGIFYIDDARREREAGQAVRKMIRQTAETDTKMVDISLPQDPGQAGKTQAADFVSMLAGWNVHATPESGDKEQRALPFAAQAEAGNVKIVAYDKDGMTLLPWVEAYLQELELFPTAKIKDQVDASSRAFSHLVGAGAMIMGTILMSSGGPRAFPGQ